MNWTPEAVRKLDRDERTSLLARYNLEVTLAELSRCKQAVQEGTIWQLAEQRSHQHPSLREAFLWLTTRPFPTGMSTDLVGDLVQDDRSAARDHHPNGGIWEQDWSRIVDKQAPQRSKTTGMRATNLGDLIFVQKFRKKNVDEILPPIDFNDFENTYF